MESTSRDGTRIFRLNARLNFWARHREAGQAGRELSLGTLRSYELGREHIFVPAGHVGLASVLHTESQIKEPLEEHRASLGAIEFVLQVEHEATIVTRMDLARLPQPEVEQIDDSGGGQTQSSRTHINDLDDNSMVEILGRVPLPQCCIIRWSATEFLPVRPPLQHALVCKRWRSLCDAVVCALRVEEGALNQHVAEKVVKRFQNLRMISCRCGLGLSGDFLVRLAELTPHLESLSLAYLFHCRKVDLVSALKQWRRLRNLYLSSSICSVVVLNSLFATSSLRSLYLCCFANRLPDSLCRYTKLEVLRVNGADRLTELPDSIGSLVNLRALLVAQCSLQAWPQSLSRLESLQILILHHCGEVPPKGLGRLPRLESLWMEGCGILPEGTGDLARLREETLHKLHRQLPSNTRLPWSLRHCFPERDDSDFVQMSEDYVVGYFLPECFKLRI